MCKMTLDVVNARDAIWMAGQHNCATTRLIRYDNQTELTFVGNAKDLMDLRYNLGYTDQEDYDHVAKIEVLNPCK